MSKDTTVPAFPGPYSNVENQGITKREWFAGLAMSGELASSTLIWSEDVFSKVAESAYKFADAMIEEGKK